MILKRNSVLKDLKIEKNGISIEELPFINKINLRGNTKDRVFMSNTGSVLDILIPTEPNTKIENKNLQVIWLSPNEWLLNFINNENFIRIFEDLSNKLNPENTSITDISESKTIIRVKGIHTKELLRKFLVLDIDNTLISNLKVATGLQNKIFMYMSYGLPVIASKDSAPKNLIKNKKNILIYSRQDDLIKCISELINKKKLANLISRNSYKIVKNKLTAKKVYNKYI